MSMSELDGFFEGILAEVVCWCATSTGFYGLSYSSGSFSPNMYVNMALLSLTDAVVYGFVKPLLAFFSAKRAQLVALSGCALLLMICACLPAKSWEMMVLSLVCRFFLDVAFATIYLLTVDVFPSSVRSTAMGIVNFASRTCTGAAPLLAQLPTWLNCGGLALLVLLGALATRQLPAESKAQGA
ncbi:unnamed protein product [Effrenium voratum]|nr:unnamed protein product [Effrenium voratum]